MDKRKTTGIIAAGLVGALALGSVAVAGATPKQSTSAKSSTTASKATKSTSRDGSHKAAKDAKSKGTKPASKNHKDGAGKGHRFGGEGDIAEALAKLSGLTEAEIKSQRKAGKSYAAIADSKNVSVDALIAETVKIETAELDAAIKAGTKTEADKTKVLSDIETRLKKAIEDTSAVKDGKGHGKGHGKGKGGHKRH